MSDLISRQAAIKALIAAVDDVGVLDKEDIKKVLDMLPSAERKGHWLYGEDEYGIDGYYCDKCNFFVPWDYKHKSINFIEDYHHCPNCGARMESEDNG